MNKSEQKCGFCKKGIEVENICGKLWHDKNTKCTSHQRCMQYSALLVQYQMKKFGGFKVKKVLKEQSRGKHLKCSICCKSGKKSKNNFGGGATAGCAISRCKKTFHFYCAKLDRNARTRRIVLRNSREVNDSDEPQILYRVFCSEEHEEMFKKIQKNIDYSEDTDNDEYKSDYTLSSSSSSDSSSDSSEGSADENAGDSNKKIGKKAGKKDDDGQPSVESNNNNTANNNNINDNDDGDDSSLQTSKQDKLNPDNRNPPKASLSKKRLNISNDKHDSNNQSNSKKLKMEHEDDNHVICFVENADHLVPSKFEILVKRAKDLFDADASKVFLWKYNLDRFTSQHMLYLLLDISQALRTRNDFEIKRLVCLLDNKDIERYEQLMLKSEEMCTDSIIKDDSQDVNSKKSEKNSTKLENNDNNNSDNTKNNTTSVEVQNKLLRKKIEENLETANEKVNQLVGKYCLLNMPEETHIVFLTLCDITDPHGEIRYHMKRPGRGRKDIKNDDTALKGSHNDSSPTDDIPDNNNNNSNKKSTTTGTKSIEDECETG